MFEKGSFKTSARYKRCIVVIDGFFEHHWYKGKSYPFYIRLKNDNPIPLAGLWENWRGKSTFSIVTTEGNPIMEKIHNNPKGSESHRMPAILPQELMHEWLQPLHDPLDQEKLLDLLQPYDEHEMEWHTVRRLRGKAYPGNVPEVLEETEYEELVF